jgi:hypothetical protein
MDVTEPSEKPTQLPAIPDAVATRFVDVCRPGGSAVQAVVAEADIAGAVRVVSLPLRTKPR